MISISDATMALLELLDRQCPREQFPQAMFAAYQPDDFTSPMEEGVSLYLFQVDLASHLASHGRRGPTLNLSYLMTAWSPDPLRQQALLAWALGAALENAVLGPHWRLDVLPLTIPDMAAVWSMARAGGQPSVAVLIREIE